MSDPRRLARRQRHAPEADDDSINAAVCHGHVVAIMEIAWHGARRWSFRPGGHRWVKPPGLTLESDEIVPLRVPLEDWFDRGAGDRALIQRAPRRPAAGAECFASSSHLQLMIWRLRSDLDA